MTQPPARGPLGPADPDMGLHQWGRHVKRMARTIGDPEALGPVKSLLRHGLDDQPLEGAVRSAAEDALRALRQFEEAMAELSRAYNAHHASDEDRLEGRRGGVAAEKRADVSRGVGEL